MAEHNQGSVLVYLISFLVCLASGVLALVGLLGLIVELLSRTAYQAKRKIRGAFGLCLFAIVAVPLAIAFGLVVGGPGMEERPNQFGE